MLHKVKPAAIGARPASNVVNDWHVSGAEVSTSQDSKQERTRAELRGDDVCDACGITVRSSAPVLAMCRALVDARHNPSSRLNAYRSGNLCLRVRSIGALLLAFLKKENKPKLHVVKNDDEATP